MNRFSNAEGDTSSAVIIAPIVDTITPPPAAPTPEPIITVVAATGSLTDRANRLAAAKIKNQASIDALVAWSGHNTEYITKLNTSIAKLTTNIANFETELAAVGGANVDSANIRVKRHSIYLSKLKTFLSKRQAQLAKATENRDKIAKWSANANERNAKLTVMSSADGSEYSNMDGVSLSPFDTKSLIIGLALGVGLTFLAIKYKHKLGF